MPNREMIDLGATYTEQDLKHSKIGSTQPERRIKARAPLFDGREVERSSIGDRLNLIGTRRQIGRGNCRSVRDVDKLRKDKVKVWIMSAAVAEIPARVHVEVHEIRQPPDLLGAGRFATRERPEGVQIHRLCADR